MIVLDASVVIKWFQEEEGSEQALVFEEKHTRGEEAISIPDLLLYELANVLRYQKIRTEAIETALEALAKMELRIFTFTPSELGEVVRLARKYDISVYDAIYVFLAKTLGCRFVTADRRLYQKLQDFSWISLL